MKTLPIDYKEYTVNTPVLLIDPPWKYDDRPKSTQIHQVTYGVWENEEGLDWIFSQPVEYIFLWATNSMLLNILQHQHKNFIYKQCVTWVKQTNKGNLAYGLGHNFRNCTEQLLLFTHKKAKPLHLNLRNVIHAPVGPRTRKPKEWEAELCRLLNDRGRSVTYVFSGPCVDVFNEFDNMICVDTCFKDENNHL